MATFKIGYDAREATKGAKEAEAAANTIGRGARDAAKEITEVDKKLKLFGKSGEGLKTKITGLFAGFAVAATIKGAIDTIGSFDEKLAQVAAISGATGDELKALERTARDLGATTKFSATEGAEALVLLSQSGFDARQSIAAAPAVLNLATAGAIGLADAADVTTAALAQFGLVAGESARVADVLAQTANTTNSDVLGIGEAFKFVGPVAGAFNKSLEEVSAAIGILGDRGIKGSLAGTNLRGVLSTLSDPTDEAKEAIDRLGISLSDIDPVSNSLVDIFHRFGQANLGATDALAIFGRQNAATSLILATNAQRFRDVTIANENARGAAEKVSRVMSDNLKGSFQELSSTIEEATLVTGDSGFRGAVRGVVDTVAGAIRVIFGFASGADKSKVSVVALATAFKGIAVALAVFTAVKTLTFLATMGTAIRALITQFRVLKAELLTNPITVLPTILATVGFLLFDMSSNLNAATEDFKETGKAAEQFANTLERFNRSQTTKERAGELGDTNEQLRQTEAQIRTLEEYIVDLKQGIKELGDSATTDFQKLRQLVAQVREPQRVIGVIGDIPNKDAVDVVQATINTLKRQSAELAANRQKVAETEEAIIARTKAENDGKAAIEATIKSMGVEIVTLKLAGVERAKYQALVKADADLQKLSAGERRKAVDEIYRAVEALYDEQEAAKARETEIEREKELTKARKDAGAALQAFLDDAREEIRISALSNAERDFEVELRRAQQIATARGTALTNDEIAVIRELVNARQGLNKVVKEYPVDAFLESMREELSLLRATDLERAQATALRQLEAAAKQEGRDLTKEEIDELRTIIDIREREKAAIEKATDAATKAASEKRDAQKSIEDLFSSMQTELELIGKTNDERESELQLRELQKNAVAAQVSDVGALTTKYKDLRDKIKAANEQHLREIRAQEEVKGLSQDTSHAVGDFFGAIVKGTENVRDAMEKAAYAIENIFFERLVQKPFENLLSSGLGSLFSSIPSLGATIASAKGNAFFGGHVVPFANGTEFLNRPTYFPLADGNTGLGGEAGPEAILKLKRTRSGDLGVVNAGGGGGTTVIFNQKVYANDAGSFRRSKKQMFNDFRGAIG